MVVLPALLMVNGLMMVCKSADGQGFSAGDGPGLRGADADRRVDCGAFVGGDAAGGDRQRSAGKRVAGRPGTDRHAVGDDGSADGDRSAGRRRKSRLVSLFSQA